MLVGSAILTGNLVDPALDISGEILLFEQGIVTSLLFQQKITIKMLSQQNITTQMSFTLEQ